MKRAFVLPDIDPNLWREFKAACAHYDISIKASLLKHIENVVNGYRNYKRGYQMTTANKERMLDKHD